MPQKLTELPTDALSSVLVRLTLAHEIAAVAPTCRSFNLAVQHASKLRPFSAEVVTLAGHTDAVASVAAVPDGRIITGSVDDTVKVWRDGACERTIQAHRFVKAVAVLPGGARFVSGGGDVGPPSVKVWTLDGNLFHNFGRRDHISGPALPTDEVGCRVNSIAAHPDGVHFVVGLDNDWRLYHVDGTLVHVFKGHDHNVNAVAVTPDGQHIISGGGDKRVRVWSVASKSLVSTCEGHRDRVMAVAVMPDGQRILSGSGSIDKIVSRDTTVRVWLLDGTLESTFNHHRPDHDAFLVEHDAMVLALVAMPDNQHALSASADKTVKLFNVNDGAVLRTFKHHAVGVRSLALLPDGLRFVSGSRDKTARIAYHGLAPQIGSAK